MTKTIFIQGSTGQTGSAITSAIAKQIPNVTIKAGVRDASKADKVKGLPNVQTAAFDIDDASTHASIKDADVLVLIPPSTPDRGEKGAAAVRIAKSAGVKHLLVLSVPDSSKDSHLLFGRQMAVMEDAVRSSGIPFTIFECVFFQDNDVWSLPALVKDPVYYRPFRADATYAPVAVADIGDAFAAVAKDVSKHVNKTYILTGPEEISGNQLAQIFSRVVGKEVKFQEVSDEAAVQSMVGSGWPKWQAEGVAELYRAYQDKKTQAKAPGDFEKLTGHKGTTLEQTLTKAKSSVGL